MFVYTNRQDDTISNTISYKGWEYNYVKNFIYIPPSYYEVYYVLDSLPFNYIVDSTNSSCFDSTAHGGLTEYWEASFCLTDTQYYNRPDTCGTSIIVDSFNSHLGYQGYINYCVNSFSSSITQMQIAERLGVISIYAGCEDDTHCDAPENYHLEYYHLANGETYGEMPTLNLTTGIATQSLDGKVQIINQCDNTIVKITGALPEGLQLKIYNVLGQKVINQPITQNVTNISTALPQGIYVWAITSNNDLKASGKIYK